MNLAKYRGLFLEETREHVTALGRELEAEPPLAPPAIDSLFRHAHSIKGMSASMGVEPLRDLAHAMEDELGLARKGERALGRAALAGLIGATDVLAEQIECWARGDAVPPASRGVDRLVRGRDPQGPAQPPPPPLLTPELLPVDSGPALLEIEALAPPGDARASSGRRGQDEPPLAAVERSSLRVATTFIDALLERVTELALAHGTLGSAWRDGDRERGRRGFEQLRRAADRLREDTMAIRLLPFSTIAPELARAARDASAATGKPVEFRILGGDLSADRAVVEALADPLVHLLRNAIDHGLEAAAERARSGKPGAGHVTIEVRREADSIYISVEDDGRGMDPDSLARKAVADGRITAAQAQSLSAADKRMLATLPGLSTAAQVTPLSGRGVGLDLVRARVEGLGGKLEIDSDPGSFTRITLRAPLTLALQRLFLVRSGSRRIALPLGRVVGLFQLRPHEIHATPDGWVAALDDDEFHPFVPLSALIGGDFEAPRSSLAGVLLEARGRRVLLGVDEALSEAEMVVRPLGRPLQRIALYSAAAILSEGQLALVLDVDGILAGGVVLPAPARAAGVS